MKETEEEADADAEQCPRGSDRRPCKVSKSTLLIRVSRHLKPRDLYTLHMSTIADH
jgi:hypothetical protein